MDPQAYFDAREAAQATTPAAHYALDHKSRSVSRTSLADHATQGRKLICSVCGKPRTWAGFHAKCPQCRSKKG